MKIYSVTADSESGDDYGPELYRNNPTGEDLRKFIKSTGEDLDIDGPGDYGSYVYLTVQEMEITEN